MEPEYSFPCSHEFDTDAYPEPHQSNSHTTTSFPYIYFTIILPYTSRSSERSLPFMLSNQIFYTYLVISPCVLNQTYRSSHPSSFDYPNNGLMCIMYKLLRLSVTLSPLGPTIFLGNLFSNAINKRPSFTSL
jgi:hypothetical protein